MEKIFAYLPQDKNATNFVLKNNSFDYSKENIFRIDSNKVIKKISGINQGISLGFSAQNGTIGLFPTAMINTIYMNNPDLCDFEKDLYNEDSSDAKVKQRDAFFQIVNDNEDLKNDEIIIYYTYDN
jgi:hypothetical protein